MNGNSAVFSAPDNSQHESPPYSAVVRVPKAAEVEWILNLNEEENELVRSEFYYEQVRALKSLTSLLMYNRRDGGGGAQPGPPHALTAQSRGS